MSVDYCMLSNEWVWLRSQVCLLRLEVGLRLSSRVGALTEMKIWCVKRMFMIKVVSSEKNKSFNNFKAQLL